MIYTGKWLKSKITRLSKSDLALLFGLILVGVSIACIFVVFYPVLKEEFRYNFEKRYVDPKVLLTNPSIKVPGYIVPVDTSFSVVIPKIGANSKVVANVDPYNSNEYQVQLTKGVAHALGTSFPGMPGNTFLFAHSSGNIFEANKYNSIFYLLNKLEYGDEIFVAYFGELYTYKVHTIKVVEAADVEYLKDENSDKSMLTLMTCWPAGTTLKRLIVQADVIN
ncbi:MAG: sortase [Patescibacteria group bacterium]